MEPFTTSFGVGGPLGLRERIFNEVFDYKSEGGDDTLLGGWGTF
jgi:hypothetical protein